MRDVTLDDLSLRIAPKTIVVCEGSSVGTRRKDFDAEIYNRILGSQISDITFVSGGASNQVSSTGVSISQTLRYIVPTAKIFSLSDRDDKSEYEVTALESGSNNIVLSRRNLESFLFEDDVIEALVMREEKSSLLANALQIKFDAIASSVARGNPPDDLKSAAGEIYVNLKQLLSLQRCGNNTDAFMRDTLAPLIVPSMNTYMALKATTIDRIPQ